MQLGPAGNRGKAEKMNIINIEHISKLYGDKMIFEDASFGIHQGIKSV